MKADEIISLTNKIKQHASSLGFDACGIAMARALPEMEHKYNSWLSNDHHALMSYMARNIEKRLNPLLLMDEAKSLIIVAQNYYPEQKQNPGSEYKISKYAYSLDYHFIIKKKLFELLDYIVLNSGIEIKAKVFTDSAPVLEREWAREAGIGQTGKNSCLIIPRKGSFFFLGGIIINILLDYDQPYTRDLCGSCTRCMQACPTAAISPAGVIDARKCISYLTIEHKDDIPEKFSGNTENWIFGCDTCQDVCPHNRFSEPVKDSFFNNLPYTQWSSWQWEELDKETYNKQIKKSKSPISRVKFEKLKGNINFIRNNKGT